VRVSELEFNVPFQHKHGYIRDENSCERNRSTVVRSPWNAVQLSSDDHVVSQSVPVVVNVVGVG